MFRRHVLALLLALAAWSNGSAAEPADWRCETKADRLMISLGEVAVCEYVFADPELPRPYFCQVKTADGLPVTRNHPPRDGKDPTDHADMHPGIWLAFGDLNGVDFWRNKGTVQQVRFVEPPVVEGSTLRFAVENEYRDGEQRIATENCRHTLVRTDDGYYLTFDSQFSCDKTLVFGDQEEMGLGIRVASPIRVKGGSGEIIDSKGRKDEAGIWGKSAAWCDYRGKTDGRTVGVAVFSHPENFRPSWLHVRDYGLMVANPFGRKAFTGGEASRMEVAAKEPFRLRFGVLVHTSADGPPDIEAAYREYLQLAK